MAIGRGDTSCTSAGGEHLGLYSDDHPESCMGCLYPSERRRLDDVVYKLQDKPKFKDTEVLDVQREPLRYLGSLVCLGRRCYVAAHMLGMRKVKADHVG